MGKVEIVNCSITADILTKSFTEMFLELATTNFMIFVQWLMLICGQGNKHALFSSKPLLCIQVSVVAHGPLVYRSNDIT